MKNLEKLVRSSQLREVGAKYNFNGRVIEVVKHLTGADQRKLGITDRKDGVQVIYGFTIDGKPFELKGTAFSNWCQVNGIEVVGKTAPNEDKKPKAFKPSQNAELASNEALTQEIERLQCILHAREEEEREKAEKERKRQEALSKLSAEERVLLGL